jgi:tRNA threonylcarbamoyladenosine modification (KEOPS) complex  Pcc1 subunit
MFTIDFTVKNTAFPLSIQRKSAEGAEAVYKEVVAAMTSNSSAILEFKCEGKTEKTIAVRASEISGLQMSEKEGSGAASGRTPGFFNIPAE